MLKSTFSDLAFRPLSRPPINLINLLVLDILFWDATGEGMDPVIVVILSKVFSSGCLNIFGFFALCWIYKPTEKKVKIYMIENKFPDISNHRKNCHVKKEVYHSCHWIQNVPISFWNDLSAYWTKHISSSHHTDHRMLLN